MAKAKRPLALVVQDDGSRYSRGDRVKLVRTPATLAQEYLAHDAPPGRTGGGLLAHAGGPSRRAVRRSDSGHLAMSQRTTLRAPHPETPGRSQIGTNQDHPALRSFDLRGVEHGLLPTDYMAVTIRIQNVGVSDADRLDERVAAVPVRVDQAGQDGPAPSVDGLAGRVLPCQVVGRTDGDDPPAVDGYGALPKDAALRVHRDHRAAADQQVNRPSFSHRVTSLDHRATTVLSS